MDTDDPTISGQWRAAKLPAWARQALERSPSDDGAVPPPGEPPRAAPSATAGDDTSAEPDAPRCAVLPSGVTRDEILDTVATLASALHLNDKALRVLGQLTRSCRWRDFADADRDPVCFRQQQRLAVDLGVSPGYFRKLEGRLEAAGLIERRTTENGRRGRLTARVGCEPVVAGLSLGPLVASWPRLADLAEQVREAAHALDEGQARMKITRREARRAIEDLPQAHAIRAEFETLRGVRFRPASEYRDQGQIEAHLQTLRDLIERARAAAPHQPDLPFDHPIWSGAPLRSERQHTDYKREKESRSCTGDDAEENQMTHAAVAETEAAQRDGTDETEHPEMSEMSETKTGQERDRSDRAEDNEDARPRSPGLRSSLPRAMLARMTPQILRAIASSEMRLYIDGMRPEANIMARIGDAAIMRRRELAIDERTWNQAEATMGWFDALLALIVLDRRRELGEKDRDTSVMQDPAAYLATMVRRARCGTLNLGSSVGKALREAATML